MNVLTDVLLPLALAFIMLSMGLALTPADFARVLRRPAAALIGLTAQMVLLPVLAFAMVVAWEAVWGMDPSLAVGFLIIAACPGGVTSNLLTHLARGDTALSISLTAVASVLASVTIPLIVTVAKDWFLGAEAPPLPLLGTIAGIFAIVTLPVLVGMVVKRLRPTFADRVEPACRHAAAGLFVVIVVAAVAVEWSLLIAHFGEIGPPVLVLNLACMVMGWSLARAARLGRGQAVAITLETGLQNGTLAVLIAATFLANHLMVVPGAVYSLVMFFTAGAYVALVAVRRRADPPCAPGSIGAGPARTVDTP